MNLLYSCFTLKCIYIKFNKHTNIIYNINECYSFEKKASKQFLTPYSFYKIVS